MKLESFFQKFDLFADAPGAVAKMRELVLRMATSGRIAEQDPSDKSASVLLREIFAERDRRIRKGTTKGRVEGSPISAGDTIDLPASWSRCMISEVCDLQTGATPSRQEHSYFGGDIPWLVSGDVNKGEITECAGRITKAGLEGSNCKIVPPNSVLIALNGQGKTRGTVALLRIAAALNQSLVAFIPYSGERLLPEYIYWNLRGRYYAIRDITGQDQRRGLNMKLVGQLSLPIPPLAEQKRIVAKVEELMALCDRLEAQQEDRDTRCAALAHASLARFGDAPTPANLDLLFHKSYSIAPADLRKSILTLAVQGILVPQDPEDEPAAELLARIRRTKGGVMDADAGFEAPSLPNGEGSPPFEIPSSWEWALATAPTVSISDFGKKIKTKEVAEKGRFPVVDQGKQFIRGYCDDEEKVIRIETPIVLFGDHTRETKLIDFDFIVGADGVKLLQPIEISAHYYLLALRWLPLDDRGYGRHFKLLRAARIPIPPLAEQRRIVAKVGELMVLIDALERQLGAARTTATSLLEAAVVELTGTPTGGGDET